MQVKLQLHAPDSPEVREASDQSASRFSTCLLEELSLVLDR